jgi:hypothetical protein
MAAGVLRALAQGAGALQAASPDDPTAFVSLLRRVLPLSAAEAPPHPASPIILP